MVAMTPLDAAGLTAIARYDLELCGSGYLTENRLVRRDDGDWVRYEDLLATVQAQQREIDLLAGSDKTAEELFLKLEQAEERVAALTTALQEARQQAIEECVPIVRRAVENYCTHPAVEGQERCYCDDIMDEVDAGLRALLAGYLVRAVGDQGRTVMADDLKWRDGTPVTARLAHDCTPDDYRLAPSGEGPLAAEWADKPHRLVYDLAGEVLRLQAQVASLTREREALTAEVVVIRDALAQEQAEGRAAAAVLTAQGVPTNGDEGSGKHWTLTLAQRIARLTQWRDEARQRAIEECIDIAKPYHAPRPCSYGCSACRERKHIVEQCRALLSSPGAPQNDVARVHDLEAQVASLTRENEALERERHEQFWPLANAVGGEGWEGRNVLVSGLIEMAKRHREGYARGWLAGRDAAALAVLEATDASCCGQRMEKAIRALPPPASEGQGAAE